MRISLCFHDAESEDLHGGMTDAQHGALVAMLQDRLQLTAAAAERCLGVMFELSAEEPAKASASAMITWLKTADDRSRRELFRSYMERAEGQGVLG